MDAYGFSSLHKQTFMITTRQFAELNGVLPESIRSRYCKTGSFWGVTPEKLINGRLRWPAKQIHKQPLKD
jgi:hypothetical protein